MLPWIARGILLLIGVGVGAGIWAKDAYFSPQATIWRECGKGESPLEPGKLILDLDCYARKMEELVGERGVEGALEVLIRVGAKIPFGDCHLGAHYIGWAALKQFGSPAEAFQGYQAESPCSAGYTHGVIEKYLEEHQDISLAGLAPVVCEAPRRSAAATRGGQWQCGHGFGHVVMAFTDYDLPKSVTVCDVFPDENRRHGCGYGVFMENTLAGHFRKDETTDWVNPDDPLFPCFSVPERYQGPCLEWAPALITRYKTKNAVDALKICTDLPADSLRRSCYMGMGREMGAKLKAEPDQIGGWCATVPKEYQQFCLQETLPYYVATPDRLVRGLDVCNAVSTQLRESCAEFLGHQMARFGLPSGQRVRWCNQLKMAREACLKPVKISFIHTK